MESPKPYLLIITTGIDDYKHRGSTASSEVVVCATRRVALHELRARLLEEMGEDAFLLSYHEDDNEEYEQYLAKEHKLVCSGEFIPYKWTYKIEQMGDIENWSPKEEEEEEEEPPTMICGICKEESETRPQCDICELPSCSLCSSWTACNSRVCKPCYRDRLKVCPKCLNEENRVLECYTMCRSCFDGLDEQEKKKVKLTEDN